MLQFGMQPLIEIKSTEACAALCRELGLAFVELNMNLPEYQANRLDDFEDAAVAVCVVICRPLCSLYQRLSLCNMLLTPVNQ
jgi:hypothetical protein